MDKTALTRKERERLRHRKEIFSAALKLFSDKGFHRVSMQDIANEAEFGVGTLYNFFKSKEDLFEELMDSTGQQILNEFMEILNGQGNEAKRLSRFFRKLPQFYRLHEDVIKLYVSVFGVHSVDFSKLRDRSNVRDKLCSILTKLIEDGICKGVFRNVAPEIGAIAIDATMAAIIFNIAEGTDEAHVVERFEKAEQLFLNGLLKPE